MLTNDILVFRDPYIVAFGPSHIEVRHLESGALLQTVWGNYRLLNSSPELLMVQSNDGRVLALQFSD
jgi:CNH domain